MCAENTFHYPPALMMLLIDAIHYLNRSKKDVFSFFQGAGVPSAIVNPILNKWRENNNIQKREIARNILKSINLNNDIYLAQRREIIKRIIEFDDFSLCWPDDQLPARGTVAKIKDIVRGRDTLTRLANEVEKTRIQHMKKRDAEILQQRIRKENINRIKTELCSLFAESNPQKRGKDLEEILNELFSIAGIGIRGSFSLKGDDREGTIEQVDGVIELHNNIYFVEMKWLSNPVGKAEISEHLVRIFSRSEARAIIISASGFTDPAITTCKEALQNKVIILCSLDEIIYLLESGNELVELLNQKVNAAIIDKNPYLRPY